MLEKVAPARNVNNLTEESLMSSRYTEEEKREILAEADMHRAIRRADAARKKYLLILEKRKRKMTERQRMPDRSHGT